jgi:hypothetical protein
MESNIYGTILKAINIHNWNKKWKKNIENEERKIFEVIIGENFP